MEMLDYWLNLLNFGSDDERYDAFNQLQAMGYFTQDDEPETWWLDVSIEMRLLYL